MKMLCVVLHLRRVYKISKAVCSRFHRLSRGLAEEVLAAKFPKEAEPVLEVGQDALCLWRRTGGLEGPLWITQTRGQGYKVFAVSWVR